MRTHLLWVALLAGLALAGCAGEDGAEGRVYGYLDASSDVTTVYLAEVGVTDSTIYTNTRYELQPGSATVGWYSSLNGWWYLDVTLASGEEGSDGEVNWILPVVPGDDGADGRDRVYDVYFDGVNGIMYYDERLVTHGTAAAEAHPAGFGNIADPDLESAIPGRLRAGP